MKSKKWMVLLGVMICVVSGSVYAWDSINAASAKENGDFTATISMEEYDLLSEQDQANFDAVVVYNDGEYTATISREEYDTLPEKDKANFDNTYKKIVEIMEKNEKVVDDETLSVQPIDFKLLKESELELVPLPTESELTTKYIIYEDWQDCMNTLQEEIISTVNIDNDFVDKLYKLDSIKKVQSDGKEMFMCVYKMMD